MEASQEEADSGAVDFCTPAPSAARRRRLPCRAVDQAPPPTLPTWAPKKHGDATKDLSAFEKRLICKVQDSLAAMLKEEDSPLLKNEEWPHSNQSNPLVGVVSHLCGSVQSAVSRCVAEASRTGGVLRSAAEGGRKKERPYGDYGEERRAGEWVALRRTAKAHCGRPQVWNG